MIRPLAYARAASWGKRIGNVLGTRTAYNADKLGDATMEQSRRVGHYDSYLLKIWRGGEGNQWRWMLQNIRTGEQKGFRDLNTLMLYLDGIHHKVENPVSDFSFHADERD